MLFGVNGQDSGAIFFRPLLLSLTHFDRATKFSMAIDLWNGGVSVTQFGDKERQPACKKNLASCSSLEVFGGPSIT